MQPNPQEIADFLTFTGEILNGKRHFCEMPTSNFNTLLTDNYRGYQDYAN